MVVRMKLLSDAIFGSGKSVPGGEDAAVLTDESGFPFMRGTTFKGILREAVTNYLLWIADPQAEQLVQSIFGDKDMTLEQSVKQVYVSDFVLSGKVRDSVSDACRVRDDGVLPYEYMTYLRTSTSLEDGLAREGTLRMIRCIDQGLVFYGEIEAADEQSRKVVSEALPFIKWIGGKRTRGLGRVEVTVEGGIN